MKVMAIVTIVLASAFAGYLGSFAAKMQKPLIYQLAIASLAGSVVAIALTIAASR